MFLVEFEKTLNIFSFPTNCNDKCSDFPAIVVEYCIDTEISTKIGRNRPVEAISVFEMGRRVEFWVPELEK